ncbi:MAG: 30S ribosome-binding factor RbfA [Chloroflexia bacterium]|jgi:ribosome-binding factor A|nr:30S ribosome-binding factor RbfA [Chloroflexia bacterium]
MSGRRRRQVGDLLRDEISFLIQRGLKDPRIGFTSITRVDVSPDIRYATVFVSVLGTEDEQSETLVALNSASGFIRHELGPKLTMRNIPMVSFRLDRSMEHAENVARLLREIDLPPETEPGAPSDSDREA